eukprot:Sspe_Gene.28157::Locus_12582_Transcript_1_3_Confidence_0.400_Length_1348::g.28157::m.28157/K03039/PSMD13, RPN9; 26S proteasome regulatory subunit N9
MALTYLDSLRTGHPELGADIDKMQEFFEKKYWHEMTVHLMDLAGKDAWNNGKILPEVYNGFITHFQSKLNSFSLAQLIIRVSRKCNPAESLALLAKCNEAFTSTANQQAHHLIKSEMVVLKLQGGAGDLAGIKEEVAATKAFMAKHDSASLHMDLRAAIYRAQAELMAIEKKYDDFYKLCLLYLAHKQVEEMPEAEKQSVAFRLGVAALLGETIHNFGELLNNPVMGSLDTMGAGWLAQLLRAFNAGNLELYAQVSEKSKSEMVQHLGSDKAEFLKTKMQLMALLQFIFVSPVNARTLTFESIQQKCRTSLDEVEPLLLRALALGLIKGQIDEIDQTIEVTWVASRVLERDEMKGITQQLKQWIKQVDETVHHVDGILLAQAQEDAILA